MIDTIEKHLVLVLAILIAAPGCGNGGGGQRVEQPTGPTPARVDTGVVADPAPTIQIPSTVFEPALPAGVEPIAPAEFVTFLSIRHGNTKNDVLVLLPPSADSLGPRADLDIMGSEGFSYSGDFVVSWRSDTAQIDYVSVKSDAAVQYLASRGRRDARLDTLWGASPQAVLGILGQPTEMVELPHAWTFRFQFDANGRAGTLSLEFSKLAETVGCSAVGVHYRY